MSLDVNVMPAVLNLLRNLPALPGQAWGGTNLLLAVSEGPTSSVPDAPAMWVQNSAFTAPALAGSDLEQTDWTIDMRLLFPWTPDSQNAERTLAMLIEPIRAGFRTHQKIDAQPPVNANPPQVVLARVIGGTWGYMTVNGIVYRFLNLTARVVEKVREVYTA